MNFRNCIENCIRRGRQSSNTEKKGPAHTSDINSKSPASADRHDSRIVYVELRETCEKRTVFRRVRLPCVRDRRTRGRDKNDSDDAPVHRKRSPVKGRPGEK